MKHTNKFIVLCLLILAADLFISGCCGTSEWYPIDHPEPPPPPPEPPHPEPPWHHEHQDEPAPPERPRPGQKEAPRKQPFGPERQDSHRQSDPIVRNEREHPPRRQ